jgi:hypothetical protein
MVQFVTQLDSTCSATSFDISRNLDTVQWTPVEFRYVSMVGWKMFIRSKLSERKIDYRTAKSLSHSIHPVSVQLGGK